jgi:RNA polymerase sigma factor (sigma-70 family)
LHNTTTYNEYELVLQLQQQSKNAFAYLYDKYNAAIYSAIVQIVKNEATAQDIMQQTFVQYWQKFAMYDNTKGRLFTWMLNIARNASIDYLRSKAAKKDSKNLSIDNNVYTSNLVTANELNIDTIGLGKYIASLKEEWRNVIQQSYLQGYTHDEIANNLQIPLGTVKTRIRSALIELRKKMTEN